MTQIDVDETSRDGGGAGKGGHTTSKEVELSFDLSFDQGTQK